MTTNVHHLRKMMLVTIKLFFHSESIVPSTACLHCSHASDVHMHQSFLRKGYTLIRKRTRCLSVPSFVKTRAYFFHGEEPRTRASTDRKKSTWTVGAPHEIRSSKDCMPALFTCLGCSQRSQTISHSYEKDTPYRLRRKPRTAPRAIVVRHR